MNGATTIIVALIVSVIAPLVLAWSTNRGRRADKQQDWDRQDKIAAQAKNDARQLREGQIVAQRAAEEAARLLAESNKDVVKSTEDIKGQLTTLQTWADGAQTAMMQSEFDARESELVMMKVLHASQPTEELEGRISGLSELVAGLRAKLDERLKAAAMVAEQTRAADRRQQHR